MFRLPRLLVAATLVAACSTPLPQTPPDDGQTDFVSATNGTREKSVDAQAPSANAGGGAPRSVEEGDIFKVAGDKLYVLNLYRGLQILDLANPDAPRLTGTSPMTGSPVEMYLRNGYAYIIISDYFTYWQVADGPAQPFHGSQVRIVDVRVPEAPVVVGGIDLEGAVSDTRIVGDVLYTVSNRYAWYSNAASTDDTNKLTVSSIDLANPAAPRLVQSLDFTGSSNHIHVSPTTLYIAQPNGDWSSPQTSISIVDIDDAQGAIQPKGSLSVDGWVDDRFQLDEYAGTFRVVSHTGGSGDDGVQHLTVLGLTPGHEGVLSTLELAKTGWLYATRFAGDRAYLVTMVSVDPLEVIDLRDPEAPVLTHSLVIPGVLHHLEVRGDRLLALGTDDRWSGVAASLFDVADPRAPKLLARVPVGGDGQSSWSNANWDDKALRVLDDQGLMLVPFSAWGQDAGGQGTYHNGFQLLEFTRETLVARGIVEQDGQVSRTAAYTTRLLSISDRSVQVVDATDRDAPVVTAKVELARDVSDLLAVGDKAITVSSDGWWWNSAQTELRVTSLAAPEGDVLGRVKLPFYPQRLLADGSDVIVLGWPFDWNGTLGAAKVSLSDPTAPVAVERVLGRTSTGTESFWTDPSTALRLGPGVIALTGSGSRRIGTDARGNETWESFSGVVVADLNAGTQQIVEIDGWAGGELVAVGTQVWTSHQEAVEGVAGAQPLARYYVDRVETAGGTATLLPKVNVPGLLAGVTDAGSTVFTRDYQWSGDSVRNALAELTIAGDRARLRRYLPLDESIGRLVVDGHHLYATTQAWWWARPSGTSEGVTLRTWETTPTQPLTEVSRLPIRGWMQLREAAGGHLFLGSGWYGGYWGGAIDKGMAPGGIAVDGGFASLGTDGLLVYSVADAAHPAYERFVRTNGWVQGLSVADGKLFVSSGLFGVQVVELGQTH